MMNTGNKIWIGLGVGAVFVAGVFLYSRKASAALLPSGFTPAPGYRGSLASRPSLMVTSPASTTPGAITQITQIEPAIWNSYQQKWVIGATVYHGATPEYRLFQAASSTKPTGAQWTTGIAAFLGISPSIVSVTGN